MWEQAIKDYDEAVRLAPQDATKAVGRAEALAGMRRFEDAQKELDRALPLADPSDRGSVLQRLALVSWLRGDEDGKKRYRDLCQALRDPKSSAALFWAVAATNAFEGDTSFFDAIIPRISGLGR